MGPKASGAGGRKPTTTTMEAATGTVDDAYGFPIPVASEQERAKCAKVESKSGRAWEREWPGPLKGARARENATASAGVMQQLSYRHLKSMCRQGVPAQFRPTVWFHASGAHDRMALEGDRVRYSELCKEGHSAPSSSSPSDSDKARNQIELDIPRTFPDHAWVSTAEGHAALRRVLVAISRYDGKTGYCQSLNYVAAFLLVALEKDEEKTFWIMASVMNEKVLADTWSKNLSGCLVEMDTLSTLLRKRQKKVADHFESIGCDVSYFATDWFLCLYCKSLPSETAARIWDSLLLEGPKVLFRVALAIIKLCRKDLLAATNPGDVLQILRSKQEALHNRCELMKVAFNGLGSLPYGKIQKYRQRSKHLM